MGRGDREGHADQRAKLVERVESDSRGKAAPISRSGAPGRALLDTAGAGAASRRARGSGPLAAPRIPIATPGSFVPTHTQLSSGSFSAPPGPEVGGPAKHGARVGPVITGLVIIGVVAPRRLAFWAICTSERWGSRRRRRPRGPRVKLRLRGLYVQPVGYSVGGGFVTGARFVGARVICGPGFVTGAETPRQRRPVHQRRRVVARFVTGARLVGGARFSARRCLVIAPRRCAVGGVFGGAFFPATRAPRGADTHHRAAGEPLRRAPPARPTRILLDHVARLLPPVSGRSPSGRPTPGRLLSGYPGRNTPPPRSRSGPADIPPLGEDSHCGGRAPGIVEPRSAR